MKNRIKPNGFLDLTGFRNGRTKPVQSLPLSELIARNQREMEKTDRLIVFCAGLLGFLSGGIILLWLVRQMWGVGL